MSNIINYGKQTISDDDIDFVVKALRSDFLTQGPTGKIFENSTTKFLEVYFCNPLILKIWTSASVKLCQSIFQTFKKHFIMIEVSSYDLALVWKVNVAFCSRFVPLFSTVHFMNGTLHLIVVALVMNWKVATFDLIGTLFQFYIFGNECEHQSVHLW